MAIAFRFSMIVAVLLAALQVSAAPASASVDVSAFSRFIKLIVTVFPLL